MLRWYLVHTKPAREAVAKQNLERQGFAVYLPLVSQPARRRDRWEEKVSPLFPRYLFVQVEVGQQPVAPIKSTVGVAQIVSHGSSMAVVPDHIVSDLQERANPDTGLHHLSQSTIFEVGRPIKVAAGPFSGVEGIFQCYSSSDRVIVLLNVLGESTRVRIPHGFITPSHAAH